MGAIVDILRLCGDDISLLKKRFHGCVFVNLTNTGHATQRYRLVITAGDVDLDDYYDFLLDNLIAMASEGFLSRLKNDKNFSTRMRTRFNSNSNKFRIDTSEQ